MSSKLQSSDGDDLSADALSVNQNSLVTENIDNGGKFACFSSVINSGNATDFDELGVSLNKRNLTIFNCGELYSILNNVNVFQRNRFIWKLVFSLITKIWLSSSRLTIKLSFLNPQYGFHYYLYVCDQINLMSSPRKMVNDEQTEVNSPLKRTRVAISPQKPSNTRMQVKQPPIQPISQTEKQLFSREIVKQVITKGKDKTIKHEIGIIDKNTALYAKPRHFLPNQFKFDSIPPQNHNYYSLGSAKVNQINKGLKTRANSVFMKSQNRYSSNSECKNKVLTENSQPRIQVSGLVTYKFSSVNAQRSICSGKINHEENLVKDLARSQISSQCMGNRFKKILQKHASRRYQDHLRKQIKIMSNLESKTDEYLDRIAADNKNQSLLYNEKAKKLNFIKDYMAHQKTNYSEGRHIVDQIVRCRSIKPQANQLKRVVKTQQSQLTNQDRQFQHRRMPKISNRIKIKHLTFVE